MSRFISISRRLSTTSAAAFFFHGQSTRHPLFRQPPAVSPPPSTRHYFSPSTTHYSHSSAAVRFSSTTPSAVPISVTSFFCCQFLLFSNLSKCFASGAKHIEDIVVVLLQIKHLLQRRFYRQCMQVVFLMCGTVVSLILRVVQAVISTAVEERTAIFCIILAGGVAAAGLLVKLLRAKLRNMHIMWPSARYNS